jgi:hypothetical protein
MSQPDLQKLQFRPGVSRESTDYANEGGWYACNLIRFRSGSVEKLGGWAINGSGYFLGTCRNLIEWISLSGYYILGIGTNLKYYVQIGGVYYDITPIRLDLALNADPVYPIYGSLGANITATDTTLTVSASTSFENAAPYVITIGSEDIYVGFASGTTLSNCVRGYNSTTAASHNLNDVISSTYVAIEATANGASPGDFVTLTDLDAFGPYTAGDLNAEFEVFGVASGFITVDTGVQSTSTTIGGGNNPAHAIFQLPVGGDINIFGNGWGVGPWVSQAPGAGLTVTSADIDGVVTTIPVDDASAFAASGYVYIESEWIQYASKTSTSLVGCTRGFGDTTATGHMAGAEVTGLQYSTDLARGWNTGITLSDTNQGFREYLRLWSSDNYGQILIFNPDGGGVYYWDPADSLSPGGAVTERAKNILDYPLADNYAPSVASNVLVTEERHIVAFGVNNTSLPSPLNAAQDPMLVAWCAQEDPASWNPQTVGTTAGNYRLSSGSKIITVSSTRQEYLIWTDSSLYSMRYLGPPYVFGFNLLATDITIASANSIVTANNITYWMGQDKFYAYSGRVDTVPCALRQYIFDDINTGQLEQIYAGQNEKYNEVWWFYPSAGSTYNNRYVIYNYLENLWYYGQLLRSAWMGSHIQAVPIAAYNRAAVLMITGVTASGAITGVSVIDGGQYTTNPPSSVTAVGGTGADCSFVLTVSSAGVVTSATVSQPGVNYLVGEVLTVLGGQGAGNVLYHETGLNDGAVNPPIPMNAYIQSADFDIGDGNQFSFVTRMIPDVDFIGSTNPSPYVNIVLEGRDYPGQGTFESGRQDTTVISSSRVTTQVYNYTNQSWIRLRARQIAFRIGSNDRDVKWQLGTPRIRIQTDGRR